MIAKTHELKTWPPFFDALQSGAKTFDLRFDDRGYQVGDIVVFREYDPAAEAYTQNVLHARVTYILHACEAPDGGLEDGYCILQVEVQR